MFPTSYKKSYVDVLFYDEDGAVGTGGRAAAAKVLSFGLLIKNKLL